MDIYPSFVPSQLGHKLCPTDIYDLVTAEVHGALLPRDAGLSVTVIRMYGEARSDDSAPLT
jgi:hypothetical protein